MKNTLTTFGAIIAVLLLASATVSAQEKKIEKKMTIVTINNGEKTVIDTTIVLTDTVGDEMNEFVFETRDGKVVHGRSGERSMVFISDDKDVPGVPGAHAMPAMPGMMHMGAMAPGALEMEGVNYRISVDGVTVNIRAPKEKSKEADRILAEVKKILMTK